MQCKNCNYKMESEHSFCPKCGVRVAGERTTTGFVKTSDGDEVIMIDKDLLLARAKRKGETFDDGSPDAGSQEWYREQMNDMTSDRYMPTDAALLITSDNRSFSFKDVKFADPEDLIPKEGRKSDYVPQSTIVPAEHGDNIVKEVFDKNGRRTATSEKSYPDTRDLLKVEVKEDLGEPIIKTTIKKEDGIKEVVQEPKAMLQPLMEDIASREDLTLEQKMLEMARSGFSDISILRWAKKVKEVMKSG